jgi:hypothetical protein
MKRYALCVWACLLVLISGCGFGVTQTEKTASDILVIGQIKNLQAYSRVDFKSFKSDIGTNISDNLLREVNEKTAKKLEQTEFNRPGGKALTVKGDIIHLDGASMRRYIVARVALADPETGETLGAANIAGKAEGSVLGLSDAATGVAEGVERLLRERMVP